MCGSYGGREVVTPGVQATFEGKAPGTVSLDVSYLKGTAWTCMQESDGKQKCGANPVGGVRVEPAGA